MNFVLHGHSVSGGITIGHAHLVSTARLEVAHYEIPEASIDSEIARFDAAVALVAGRLGSTRLIDNMELPDRGTPQHGVAT